MICYKMDILQALADKGYNTYRIKQDKLLSESTVQSLRAGKMVGIKSIDTICRLLECDVGDVIKYKDDYVAKYF